MDAPASAPGFSWSQVVRKEKKAASSASGGGTGGSGEASMKEEAGGQKNDVNSVAEKMGSMFPAAAEAGAAASVEEKVAMSATTKAANLSTSKDSSAEEDVGGTRASDRPAQQQEKGAPQPKAGGSAPLVISEAQAAQAAGAPKPLKSVWVGSGAQAQNQGNAVESPVAVKVLSTSSQSWPTLGDSKTEPQKRGLSLSNTVESSGQMNSNQHQHGNSREGRGNYHNKRGNGGNREYNNSRGSSSNNSNSAGVSGSHNNRHSRGRQNGGHKGNNASGNQSNSGGGNVNQNGWNNNGNINGNNQGRNYRNNRNNQNAGRNSNRNNNNQGHQQMNGMKGMGHQQMNGMGGPPHQQPPAGFYMPVYYAPMSTAGPGGPMYMMPPPQPLVNPPQQVGGTSQQQAPAKDGVLEAVKVQVEYYFSVQNLVKDMFLRAKMDENGWIPIGVIANFNRVRALAPNPAMITAALEGSLLVEVSQDQESIRVRDNWQSWVLPEERRDAQAKRPQSSPGSPVPMGMPAGMSMASMYPCTEVSNDMLDRLTLIGRLASGDPVQDSEALVMTNDVAAMVNNGIAVLESQLRSQSEAVDTLPMVSNHFYPIAPMLSQQQPNTKDQQMPLVAPSTFGSHIGWMFVNNPADVAGKEGGADTVRHCTINEFGHPAYGYFKTNNYVQIKYKDFIDCCMKKKLDQASPSAGTHTPEMYTLYQFWGLFLRDVFNASMYEEFKQCALADHKEGRGSFGITCLFGLYHNRLLKEFRPVLFKDFEAIVQQEYKKGNHQVMMEFNAFCMSTGLMKPAMNGAAEDPTQMLAQPQASVEANE